MREHIFPDDTIDTFPERDMQFEDEPPTDWHKVNADRTGWGFELCPCGLMFYVERQCDHGAGLLARLDDELLCEAECSNEADWLLLCRKQSEGAWVFRRANVCTDHIEAEESAHQQAGWQTITPELF